MGLRRTQGVSDLGATRRSDALDLAPFDIEGGRTVGEQLSPDIEGLNEPRKRIRVRSRGAEAAKAKPTITPAKLTTAEEVAKSRELSQATSIISGGAQVLGGILNANAQYDQISAKARLNIQLAGHQVSEAISRGKEGALKEETKGISRGQDTLLSMAAQGQDVRGVLATGQQRGEELFGVYNAMQVEVNSIREAYGYKAQAEMYESDIRQAKISRDSAIFSSVLQGGASIYAGFI